jgi:hypothetical protein
MEDQKSDEVKQGAHSIAKAPYPQSQAQSYCISDRK